MSEDNATPEVPKEESKPSMFGRVKGFVKEYKLPLACTATGTFVFAVTYSALASKIDGLEFSMTCLKEELSEAGLENFALQEFVDHKNLRGKFEEFVEQQIV